MILIELLELFIKEEENKYPYHNKSLEEFLIFLKKNYKMITLLKQEGEEVVKVCKIEVIGDKYRTHEGLLDGQIKTTAWVICNHKNKNSLDKQIEKLKNEKIKLGYYEFTQ